MKTKNTPLYFSVAIALLGFLSFYPEGAQANNDTVPRQAPIIEITIALNINGEAFVTPETLLPNLPQGEDIDNISIGTHRFDVSTLGKNLVDISIYKYGNCTRETAIVHVIDTFPPIVETKNITLFLGKQESVSVQAFELDNGSFDNSSKFDLSLSTNEFNCSHIGRNKVVVNATDAFGNTSSSVAWVTVVDAVAPKVFVRDITVILNENGMASILPSDINNGSYDQCGILSMELDKSNFGPTDIGRNTVQLKVTDIHDNFAIASATVIVLPEIQNYLGTERETQDNTNL